MAEVRLAVIEGGKQQGRGRHWSTSDAATVQDVEAEAARRLRAAGVQQHRTRAFISGLPIPEDILHFELQIAFAASAISRLSPIPADYAADIYWPTYWGA